MESKMSESINALELDRLKNRSNAMLAQQAANENPNLGMPKTVFDIIAEQPTVAESTQAAFRNTPVVRATKNIWNTMFMAKDPDFDPIPHIAAVENELGMGTASKLYESSSREEFEYRLKDLRQQRNNQILASTSLRGQITQVLASQASVENLLMTAATAGVGYLGVVAKTAKAGIMANQMRGAVTGGVTGYVGADIDADNMIGFSHEDIGWSLALGTVGGGLYGRFVGRRYAPKAASPIQPNINDFGGAVYETAQAMYNRSIGKGYKRYVDMNSAKAVDSAELKEAIATKRTAIFAEHIDDFDFSIVHDPKADLKVATAEWAARNNIDERAKNITKAEKFYDSLGTLQTEYAKLATSKSPVARMLGINMYEQGTASLVKLNSGAVEMERMSQAFSNMYVPKVKTMFNAYSNRVASEQGLGKFDQFTNYFKLRGAFNEEVVMYMNAVRNGRKVEKVSAEVKALADELDLANEHIYNQAVKHGVGGFDLIKYKKGFLHQRHERDYYIRARNKYGRDTLVTVLHKALMSNGGAGIKDTVKAKKIANAFVNRFTDKPTDLRAGSVLDDDAWNVLQEVFEAEGLDFDGKDIKELFNSMTAQKAKDAGRARYAKDRVPLDLTAEHNGLRMIDLINTDVEHLTGAYAMNMSGNIAMAKRGIPDRGTWNKIKQAILKEDPELEQSLDDLYNTFSTGRVAGGVQDSRIALLLKATALSMLNNLGMAQLAESGTAMATYGVTNFFEHGTEAMRGMFKGGFIKGVSEGTASTRLAREIDEMLFPIGKEHHAMPPHLNQELQSNSRLSMASFSDGVETAVNAGLTLQGNTSLFNQTRSAQHAIAYNGLVNKIGRYIHAGKAMDEQLASLGFSEQMFDAVKSNIAKHGKLYDNGKVDMLGFSKWDDDLRDQFINIVVRNQNSLVQKAMAGESTAWMSKDFGALLVQFKRFPIESVRKQLIRKATIGTDHLAASMALNTVVAGTVITARNYLNGSDTSVDFKRLLQNSATYNSDLGSVASMWDIGLSLTGAPQSWAINPYASYGETISLPSLSFANRAMDLPSTVIDALDFDLEDSDSYRTIRALPIIGNIPLLGALQRK